MAKDQEYWLNKLATLRIDRSRGNPTPHKPLLLLVIMEMAEKGEIPNREVALSPDLAFRFSVFWSVVAKRRRQPPEIRLPFHHLGSSGIWQPLTPDGKPSPDRKLTTKISFDPAFFDYLADQNFRDRARRVLIETEPYFLPEERTALYSMLQIKPRAPEDYKRLHFSKNTWGDFLNWEKQREVPIATLLCFADNMELGRRPRIKRIVKDKECTLLMDDEKEHITRVEYDESKGCLMVEPRGFISKKDFIFDSEKKCFVIFGIPIYESDSIS